MPPPENGFPQAFGKYRLLRKLARGGMAELFLATDENRRPVVIKRVLPHLTQEPDFLKMFLNEARVAALLNHPGIVKVFDLGMEGEHLYIAMDFIDGYDLETLAKLCNGRLPPAVVARVGADVCTALFYANNHDDLEGQPLNIVHRDVTPGNVMVTRRGVVKLVDFGVAKAAAQLERTRPGVVKGKFRYMSPEQISFKELDGRSDLFSLGVLLYEVATGERPFERKQLLDIINALTSWALVDPHTLDFHAARRVAVHAEELLDKPRIAATLDEVVGDCRWVVGTSSRKVRGKRWLTPEEVAKEVRERGRTALVFGDERSGLSNAEIDRCHDLSFIPTEPEQPSVNLAQAVLIYLWELRRGGPGKAERTGGATDGELTVLEQSLREALRQSGFLRGPERNALRDLLATLRRSKLSRREARLWIGAAKSLLKSPP